MREISAVQRGFEERHGGEPTTTSQLLGLLFAYAKDLSHLTEFGVCNPHTTYALLLALEEHGGRLVSVDIVNEYPGAIDQVRKDAEAVGISFEYIVGNVLDITIEETDLLFIDDHHCLEHLGNELERHSPQVRRFIAFHDTESPCNMLPAVEGFLAKHSSEWELIRHFRLSHGLTIIRRKRG